jgi:GNAT superfamily N-acetyltransferase
MSVRIRRYEPGDLEACRSLWVELTQQHRDIYEVETIGGDDPGLIFDEHLERVGPDNVWVATDGEDVIGLTGILETDELVEVEPVIVALNRRGAGIGRALVDHVIGVARERGVSFLSVRPVGRNTDAIRFFHESGFTTLGHIEMFIDLEGGRDWISGPEIAARDFDV